MEINSTCLLYLKSHNFKKKVADVSIMFQILEVAGALTHDSFMTFSFPQGEGPHIQPPTALLKY